MKCSNKLLSQRLQQEERQQHAEKAIAWEKIQKLQPAMATLIADCGRVFGKPAAIKVEIEGEIILNQGEFSPAKRFFNGKLR